MQCKICQKEFIANKYHPHQQVCSQPECQHQRQINNEKKWRMRNPEYFKCNSQEEHWHQIRRHHRKLWRVRHKDDLRNYGKNHRQQRREYMRNYMHKYRLAKFVNRDKS